jgi:hypothetical protein
MLPADLALLHDPIFREYVELFAGDENEFFTTFANAYGKVSFLFLILLFWLLFIFLDAAPLSVFPLL